MSQENKSFVTAVVRRIAFSGLAILGAWLLLYWLRGAIPRGTIDLMNAELVGTARGGEPIPLDPRSWDWSRSLWTGEPVSIVVGDRLGQTLQLIAVSGLVSLVLAVILLFAGFLVGRATQHSGRLVKIRSVLRLVLVSGGVAIPSFVFVTLLVVGLIPHVRPSLRPDSPWVVPLTASYVSLMPAWLLVQAGHGELVNRQDLPLPALAGHMAVYLATRLLRLTGVIIVVSTAFLTGLGPGFASALNQRDFPVVFGIAFVLAIIVVSAKLAADLLELTCQNVAKNLERTEAPSPLRSAIPIGWVIFALALAGLTIVAAVIGPEFAPHGWNEIMLQFRLAPRGPGLLLGADNIGRDIFSRIIYGVRLDLAAALSRALPIMILGTGWALMAGFLRNASKRSGEVFQDLALLPVEILRAFPFLVLPLIIVDMRGPGLAAILLGAGMALLPRIVLMILEAGRSSDRADKWPGRLALAVPVASLFVVPAIILIVSSASYLGLGVPPPYPELGGMLSGAGRQFMMVAPWMAVWPGVALSLLIFVWVMAGDALAERMGFRSKELWSKTME